MINKSSKKLVKMENTTSDLCSPTLVVLYCKKKINLCRLLEVV